LVLSEEENAVKMGILDSSSTRGAFLPETPGGDACRQRGKKQ